MNFILHWKFLSVHFCFKHFTDYDDSEYFTTSGSGCSKLAMSLVNISLKFHMLIFQICQHFLLLKYEKLFSTKISVHLVIKS